MTSKQVGTLITTNPHEREQYMKQYNELPSELQDIIDYYSRRWSWHKCIKHIHSSPEWKESNVSYNKERIEELFPNSNGDVTPDIDFITRATIDLSYHIQYVSFIVARLRFSDKNMTCYQQKTFKNIDLPFNTISNKIFSRRTNWKKEVWCPLTYNVYGSVSHPLSELQYNGVPNIMYSAITRYQLPILFTSSFNYIAKLKHYRKMDKMQQGVW